MVEVADMADMAQCRICLETDRRDQMISPCLCRGSQRYIHRDCLDQWRERNVNEGYYRCNTCHFRYRLSRRWWGDLLSSKWTSGALAGVGLIGGGWALGYGSSAAYNGLYYWFHHMKYMSPHRLQVLFHGTAWVGLPGFGIGISKLWENVGALGRVDAPRVNVNIPLDWISRPSYPSTVHHYHHEEKSGGHRSHTDDNIPPEEEDESESEEETDTLRRRKPKKPKVAPYEPKSGALWCVLITGVACSFYYSYDWVRTKCMRLCASAQGMVENIQL